MTEVVRILAFTDPHGDLEAAGRILDQARESRPDLVVCSGDFSYFGEAHGPFLDRLSHLGRTIFFVGGNHETPDVSRRAAETYPFFRNVETLRVEAGGIQVLGVPSLRELSPPGPEKLSVAEELMARWPDVDRSRPILLLSHYPPAGTRCDGLRRRPGDDRPVDLPGGDEGGSRVVRKILDALTPDLLICGHYHQCFGMEHQIARTRIVNPGPSGKVLDLPVPEA